VIVGAYEQQTLQFVSGAAQGEPRRVYEVHKRAADFCTARLSAPIAPGELAQNRRRFPSPPSLAPNRPLGWREALAVARAGLPNSGNRGDLQSVPRLAICPRPT